MEWQMLKKKISLQDKVRCTTIREQTCVADILNKKANNQNGDGLVMLPEEKRTGEKRDCQNGIPEQEKEGKVRGGEMI